mmetsp:Transcript_10598/g.10681  ORF Transcript_10598/g.10681 Transcript_10598/m.10681 type:complete len:174 (+) Transcript_10598:31-552(+)
MFRKVLASILFLTLLGMSQAEDFSHVEKFLWWDAVPWPPKWWPPKWWPWGKDDPTDPDDPDDPTDPADFSYSCSKCIERMAEEADFDWESILNGNTEFTDESFPANDNAMFWPDPYSDDMMTSMMRDTYEFRRVKEDDEIPEPAALFVNPSTDYFHQADQLYLGDCYFIQTCS